MKTLFPSVVAVLLLPADTWAMPLPSSAIIFTNNPGYGDVSYWAATDFLLSPLNWFVPIVEGFTDFKRAKRQYDHHAFSPKANNLSPANSLSPAHSLSTVRRGGVAQGGGDIGAQDGGAPSAGSFLFWIGRQQTCVEDKPFHNAELVFPLHKQHNHAPGIVECPNGDLLVSWYRGSGERTADDVAIYAARKRPNAAKWSDPFLIADTPGFPDCNTALWIDKDEKLWLFWPVILAHSWESCLTHYRYSVDYQKEGPPVWKWQGNILLKPKDFEEVMLREFAVWKKQVSDTTKMPVEISDEIVKKKVSDKLLARLGWQPRCKPTVLKSGRILLPLYSDTYSAGIMAISDDGGQTWTASQPLAGFGSIQPAVLERHDGTLVAYMRENGLFKKVRACQSQDGGVTWGSVYSTELPNPGAGLDAVRLANGNWLIVYNDTTRGRNSLAVSLSDDEGKTWKWTRHLEKHDTGQFHYPAVIQAKDGSIHVVYSYFVSGGKSMKHARFNEAWVKNGDPQ